VLSGAGAYKGGSVEEGLHEALCGHVTRPRTCWSSFVAKVILDYSGKPTNHVLGSHTDCRSLFLRGQRAEGPDGAGSFGCVDGQHCQKYVNSAPETFDVAGSSISTIRTR
jgi:hypothetical protein